MIEDMCIGDIVRDHLFIFGNTYVFLTLVYAYEYMLKNYDVFFTSWGTYEIQKQVMEYTIGEFLILYINLIPQLFMYSFVISTLVFIIYMYTNRWIYPLVTWIILIKIYIIIFIWGI